MGTPGLIVNNLAIWNGDTVMVGQEQLMIQANSIWNPRILINKTAAGASTSTRYIIDLRTINRTKPFGLRWFPIVSSIPVVNGIPVAKPLNHTTLEQGKHEDQPTGSTYVEEVKDGNGGIIDNLWMLSVSPQDESEVYYLQLNGYTAEDGNPVPDGEDQGARHTFENALTVSSAEVKPAGDVPKFNI